MISDSFTEDATGPELEDGEDEEDEIGITEVLAPYLVNTDAEGEVLISVVRAAFDAAGYRYQQIDAQSLIVTLRCERAVYGVFFGANDSTNLVRLTTSYGSTVPEDRRVAIAEAVTRINARFSFGNFDLDFEDGELRFRIGIDVEDGLLSEQMVNNMLGCALQAMDRFHPALMRIAFGDVEPAAAIAEVP